MTDKVSAFLKPENKPVEEHDEFSFLDEVDFGAVEARTEQMQEGGMEVPEASSECEGGGCKI